MALSQVFVNTDCVVNRLFGHSADRQTLAQAIGQRPVVTSWYVLMEYQLTVVDGFLFFYHTLRKESSVDDALAVLASDYRGRIRAVLPMLIQHLRGLDLLYQDKNAALRRLETAIQDELLMVFRRHIDGFVGSDLWRPYADFQPPLDPTAFRERLRPENDPALPPSQGGKPFQTRFNSNHKDS